MNKRIDPEVTEKGMAFTLDSVDKIISHWFLNSEQAVRIVAETPEWLNDRKLIARVTVNGIEMPFAEFDAWMLKTYERAYEEAQVSFSDLDKEVEKRLKKRIKDEAEPILDNLWKLQQALGDAEEAIIPYWDKRVFIVKNAGGTIIDVISAKDEEDAFFKFKNGDLLLEEDGYSIKEFRR